MKKSTLAGVALFAAAAMSIVSCKKTNAPAAIPGIVTPKTTSTSFTPLPTNLSVGLVAYWPGTNSGYDFSGNGHNANVLNAITAVIDHSSNTNGAFGFNGTSSYISVPDNLSLRLFNQDFSMNAWVYLVGYNPYNASVLLGKRGTGAGNGWSWGPEGAMGLNPGFAVFNAGAAPYCFSGSALSTGSWHMVTCVYTITNRIMTMYIDGALSGSPTNITTPSPSTTNLLYMGMDDPSIISGSINPATAGAFLNGRLDNICIYNRALSATDVTALHTSTTAPTNGLIAYWPLVNTTNDFSGSSYTGTPTALTPIFDRFNNNIGAYEFDGATSSIAVADATPLRLSSGSFSLNAWVKLYSYSSTASIIMGKRVVGSANNGWSWGITNTGYINYANGSTNSLSNAPISTGIWHMVTVTYDAASSQRLSLYIDNVLHGSYTGVAPANASTAASLYIGRDNPTTGAYFFNGAINDLRIYNRSLAVADVNNLYYALN